MTSRLLLKAPAKINLYLEITGDRPDGYHELVMVMQSVDLCDLIHLRLTGTETIQIHCPHPEVPKDETNLAYRAARLMQQHYPDFGGVEIAIDKHIPLGAGLAGGSANAASVLVGLDLLWNLGLTQPQLWELGAQLGSDVPFCISGGTALAVGRGEKISPLPDLENLALVICKPRNLAISTVWAYQTFRSQQLLANSPIKGRNHSKQILAAIADHKHSPNQQQDIASLLYNDLERVVLPVHPQITAIKEALAQQETLGVLMSGSGSTVFAIANDLSTAQHIAQTMSTNFHDLDVWAVTSLTNGITEVE